MPPVEKAPLDQGMSPPVKDKDIVIDQIPVSQDKTVPKVSAA